MRIAQAVEPEHSSTFCDINRSVFQQGSTMETQYKEVVFYFNVGHLKLLQSFKSLKDTLKNDTVNNRLRLIPLTE